MKDYIDGRLYVGDVSPSTSKEDLEHAFGKYGTIVDVWLARNPPGFAFVEFKNQRDADAALNALDGYSFKGSKLKVEHSRAGRGRGRGGSRGGGRSRGGFGFRGGRGGSRGRGDYDRDGYRDDRSRYNRSDPYSDYSYRNRSPVGRRSPAGRYSPPRGRDYGGRDPYPPRGRDFGRDSFQQRGGRDFIERDREFGRDRDFTRSRRDDGFGSSYNGRYEAADRGYDRAPALDRGYDRPSYDRFGSSSYDRAGPAADRGSYDKPSYDRGGAGGSYDRRGYDRPPARRSPPPRR